MAAKIFPGELIGREIIIVKAGDSSLIGWQGKIVDETKSTLKLSHHGEVKTLLKQNLAFKIKGTETILSGDQLARRPEDRLKGK